MDKNWPDGEVSYRLNNFSPDLEERFQTRAVVVAWRTWQWRIERLKLRRERNPTAHVDINVEFHLPDHFSSPNVFAHAYFPGQGDISGDTHINDNWDWVSGVHLEKMNYPPLVPILIHEFGHSLGLRHDGTTTQSIMFPSYSIGSGKTVLGPNDVERIQGRYGARTLPQHIIDYFRRRRQTNWDF